MAVGDGETGVATPLRTIRRRSPAADERAVREAFDEAAADGLLCGLPLTLSGEEGAAARRVRRVGDALAKTLGCVVQYWDERFSTVGAERALLEGNVSRKRRKVVIDHVAASLLLQAFLNARGKGDRDAAGG